MRPEYIRYKLESLKSGIRDIDERLHKLTNEIDAMIDKFMDQEEKQMEKKYE
jgi:chaperonin cofactor prefoldin